MAIEVPLILGGVALAVMTIVSMFASRQRRLGKKTAVDQTRILIHAINDDRCTGCDACVAVCPTNVLDLINNKSRVQRFQDCIQCEACMWACPTDALVMFPEGTQPPPVNTPDIDQYFQTAVPGQYLIGEVAGKPLVKNAANLGRAVVEHMLQNGLQPTQGSGSEVDVLIVGSGPGGMSAALTCIRNGISYIVIEKENILSSTVSRYPKGKSVMAEPYDTSNLSFLPVFDSKKEEMVGVWNDLADQVDLQTKMHETVQTVQRQPDGSFLTETTGGQYRSQRIVLATGTRGKPRTLGVPGEQHPKVESLLEDPADHQGKAVCVIGGGDSALEAALALGEAGAQVIISYRGRSFNRAQAKNKELIQEMMARGELKVKLQSEVIEFGDDTITLRMADGTQKRYKNQAAFVLIGADPPTKWLGMLGVHYSEKPHMAPTPASDILVRQLSPQAQECPQNSGDAAKLIFGESVPQHSTSDRSQHNARGRSQKSELARGGRKQSSRANSIFGFGKKDVRPIPLSEFAKRGRKKQKPPPRDQLQEGERTRILRMLSDEGGRLAYEDSQYQVGDERQGRADSWAKDRFTPPTKALIVGLAKATASRPRRQKSRQRLTAPEFLSPEESRHLVDLKDIAPRKKPRRRHLSPAYDEDVSFDERTQIFQQHNKPRSLSDVDWDIDD